MDLETKLTIIGVIISLIAIIIPLYKYILDRNSALRDLRFKTYHNLIRQLVEPEDGKDGIMVDRQIAVIFELRNFPEYYELTKRMLFDLKKQWEPGIRNIRIIKEITYSIKYIQIYQSWMWIPLKFLGLTGIVHFTAKLYSQHYQIKGK